MSLPRANELPPADTFVGLWHFTRRRRRPVPPPPSAFARFGAGSWIVPPASVSEPSLVSIGAGVVVLEHARIAVAPGARLRLGDGCRFGRFLSIACGASVEIGDEVSGSDLVAITDSVGPVPGRTGDPPPAPVVVERGAYLGAGCVVGPGVRIGEGAYVGEGAVVVDDVPAHAVVRGNPAC